MSNLSHLSIQIHENEKFKIFWKIIDTLHDVFDRAELPKQIRTLKPMLQKRNNRNNNSANNNNENTTRGSISFTKPENVDKVLISLAFSPGQRKAFFEILHKLEKNTSIKLKTMDGLKKALFKTILKYQSLSRKNTYNIHPKGKYDLQDQMPVNYFLSWLEQIPKKKYVIDATKYSLETNELLTSKEKKIASVFNKNAYITPAQLIDPSPTSTKNFTGLLLPSDIMKYQADLGGVYMWYMGSHNELYNTIEYYIIASAYLHNLIVSKIPQHNKNATIDDMAFYFTEINSKKALEDNLCIVCVRIYKRSSINVLAESQTFLDAYVLNMNKFFEQYKQSIYEKIERILTTHYQRYIPGFANRSYTPDIYDIKSFSSPRTELGVGKLIKLLNEKTPITLGDSVYKRRLRISLDWKRSFDSFQVETVRDLNAQKIPTYILTNDLLCGVNGLLKGSNTILEYRGIYHIYTRNDMIHNLNEVSYTNYIKHITFLQNKNRDVRNMMAYMTRFVDKFVNKKTKKVQKSVGNKTLGINHTQIPGYTQQLYMQQLTNLQTYKTYLEGLLQYYKNIESKITPESVKQLLNQMKTELDKIKRSNVELNNKYYRNDNINTSRYNNINMNTNIWQHKLTNQYLSNSLRSKAIQYKHRTFYNGMPTESDYNKLYIHLRNRYKTLHNQYNNYLSNKSPNKLNQLNYSIAEYHKFILQQLSGIPIMSNRMNNSNNNSISGIQNISNRMNTS